MSYSLKSKIEDTNQPIPHGTKILISELVKFVGRKRAKGVVLTEIANYLKQNKVQHDPVVNNSNVEIRIWRDLNGAESHAPNQFSTPKSNPFVSIEFSEQFAHIKLKKNDPRLSHIIDYLRN